MCFYFLLDGNGPEPRMSGRGTRTKAIVFAVVFNYMCSRACFCCGFVPFHTVSVPQTFRPHKWSANIWNTCIWHAILEFRWIDGAHVRLEWNNILSPQLRNRICLFICFQLAGKLHCVENLQRALADGMFLRKWSLQNCIELGLNWFSLFGQYFRKNNNNNWDYYRISALSPRTVCRDTRSVYCSHSRNVI